MNLFFLLKLQIKSILSDINALTSNTNKSSDRKLFWNI